MGEGTPSQVWIGGTPLLRSGQGVQGGIHVQGGVPLAFTQEDFLVLCNSFDNQHALFLDARFRRENRTQISRWRTTGVFNTYWSTAERLPTANFTVGSDKVAHWTFVVSSGSKASSGWVSYREHHCND